MNHQYLCSWMAVLAIAYCAAVGADDDLPAKPVGTKPSSAPADFVTLSIVRQWDEPVIRKGSPGTESNKHGFEGGCVLKLDDTYHLFTSEMVGDPFWVKMKLGHWTSHDRMSWKRVSTLYESSGEFEGKDPRAALWAPMPIYTPRDERWELFYVAYRAKPDSKTQFLNNHEGRIWRAISTVKGKQGIDGPYKDAGVILEPDNDSEPWEGLQGTDSFYPYHVGATWYGFYGSAQTQSKPIQFWGVGLAKSSDLAGPWKRCPELNPVLMDPVFVENPVVTRLPNGTYVAVFDTFIDYGLGYSVSNDGIHWPAARHIVLKKTQTLWVKDVRTPLGLIDGKRPVNPILFL